MCNIWRILFLFLLMLLQTLQCTPLCHTVEAHGNNGTNTCPARLGDGGGVAVFAALHPTIRIRQVHIPCFHCPTKVGRWSWRYMHMKASQHTVLVVKKKQTQKN